MLKPGIVPAILIHRNRRESGRGIEMNLFGFFVRLTHHRDMRKWESATAVFTGKSEKATIRTKMGPRAADYNAYEIVYDADGTRRNGWYVFHPLDDPDPQSLAGRTMNIRYRKDKPFIFENDLPEE